MALPASPPRIATWALVSLALVASVVLSSEADAYVRSKSCIPGASGPLGCETGQEPVPLWWRSDCVYMHLNDEGTKQLAHDEIASTLARSCAEWTDVPCSFMQLELVAGTDEDRVGYNPRYSQNANVIVFRDDGWPHPSPPPPFGDVLALTSTTYDFHSGEMVDADIEFNTAEYTFTANLLAEASNIDLENTAVHELGHVLGLDHTPVQAATMFDRAPVGEIKKRSLDQDDINGVCDMYPLGNAVSFSCSQSTEYYLAPERDIDDRKAKDGCSTMTHVKPAPGSSVTLFAALVLLTFYRRRRGR